MAGFGPTPSHFMGASDPNQRLQYYSSQQAQPHAAPNAGKDIGGRRAGKVKFFDTQKVNLVCIYTLLSKISKLLPFQ